MKRRIPLAMAVAWLLGCFSAPLMAQDRQQDLEETLDRAQEALTDLRIEDTETLLRHAPVQEDARAAYLLASLRHHQGRYTDGVSALERSLELQPATHTEDARSALLTLLRSTAEATRRFVQQESPDGRFIVQHAPGRDAHLVPYAFDALARADAALYEELGYRVPGPVRLEIYGSPEGLAAVSSLTVENIETSGTIALCKWDRLMVTSPRALLRGYPWMDTIAHEFVHLVLARMTRDHAPVWVQEGVAKFLERRWREPRAAHRMPPAVRGILDRAVESDSLLPFERLHPSIALLPSQEQAALAFAQVSSFIALYYQTYGREALQQALHQMASGEDAQAALGNAASRPFEALERTWRASLSEPSGDSDAPEFIGLRFGGEEVGSLGAEARRWLRLGDMLWDRGRFGAAAHEYGRALRAAPGAPLVAARLARAALAHSSRTRADDGREPTSRPSNTAAPSADIALAIETLAPIAESHPDYAPVRAYLGSAYRVVGDRERAVEHAEAAIALNPFDPRPHCDLAALLEGTDADREQRQCADLGGQRP